jgi:hypothetical protein
LALAGGRVQLIDQSHQLAMVRIDLAMIDLQVRPPFKICHAASLLEGQGPPARQFEHADRLHQRLRMRIQ